jgi:hypothetical protein
MMEACETATIKAPIAFHSLAHPWVGERERRLIGGAPTDRADKADAGSTDGDDLTRRFIRLSQLRIDGIPAIFWPIVI